MEFFSVEITQAYQVLGNVETRKVYDQEVGSYFVLRGSTKNETIRPVWRLLDGRIVNIDARNIKQVLIFFTVSEVNLYSLCHLCKTQFFTCLG